MTSRWGPTRCGIPWLMLRIPGVKTVMVIGQGDEYSCAGLFVARDQLVRIPIQQRPLRAKLFVPEPRWRPVMFELIFVLPLALDIHIACVPVPGFGHALRTPVSPDTELGIAVPIRRFVIEQRIPRGLERTVACKIGDWRLQGHIVPQATRDRLRYGVIVPCRRLPRCLIQPFLDDLCHRSPCRRPSSRAAMRKTGRNPACTD